MRGRSVGLFAAGMLVLDFAGAPPPAGASEEVVAAAARMPQVGTEEGVTPAGVTRLGLPSTGSRGGEPPGSTNSRGRLAHLCVSTGRSVPPPGPREAVRETTNARRGEVNGTQSARGRRVVRILAERFSFTPSEIRVPRGVTLELRVRSDDTMHGFRIAARSVNVMVPKRRQGEAVVVFEATEPGRYEFECSRLCGAGHNFMRGAIVVEEIPAAGRGARP